jgi:beta-glucosidase
LAGRGHRPVAHRESDLLAFQIAIEHAQPGAIMSSYNKVNGDYTGGNSVLLQEVLKGAWGYPGWVMSDWGATPSWEFALKGSTRNAASRPTRRSGGRGVYGAAQADLHAGRVPQGALSEMVRRILRSMYAVGIDAWDGEFEVDLAAHNEISLETARQGIVLLKNDRVLPLTDQRLKIAVIGGYAQLGVVSGTGSGNVVPAGGSGSRQSAGLSGW